eukprot:TRINITY_DN4740_c1_g1_i1.p1 TRINITY_DN4740_c1_g1~~TRINITY_DN4740_c1_g1_i1.p1  ORF type:complete len:376 (-),score=81.10 TRINITY_DN4740_c1_g1_i1:409-1536(-)
MLVQQAARPRYQIHTLPQTKTLQPRQQQIFRPQALAVASAGIKEVLHNLLEHKNLGEQETHDVFQELLKSQNELQIATFLALLSSKNETAEEIAGIAKVLRENAVHVPIDDDVVDIAGTGGDSIGSVNISTGASIVCAAAGAKIAKHGNRSVSSKCGSADVLEELGVKLELSPDGVVKCVEEAGIAFMFAPVYNPIMKTVQPIRRAMGVRTVLNILGPMLNPAKAPYSLIGVYSPTISEIYGEALLRLGCKKSLIVHSMGLDELTPLGPASVVEVTRDGVRKYDSDPLDVGVPRCTVEDLKGGERELNAQILRDVFGGQKGPVADAFNLNAGFALAAACIAKNPQEGVMMAREAQEAGKAGDVLRKWIEVSQKLQ